MAGEEMHRFTAPVIANVINMSLSYGYFLDVWKCALRRPLLKNLIFFSRISDVSVINHMFPS